MKNLTNKQTQLVAEWQAVAKTLKKAKQEESKLRDELVGTLFKQQTEGPVKLDMVTVDGEVLCLKAVFKYTRTIDERALPGVLKKLPKGTKKHLVKTKSSIISKGYENLSADEQEIFDECITIKPAKPSLALVEKDVL